MQQAVIQTTGLTKRYGSTEALSQLDLAIPAGSIFGYLGPNGSGKSTTIRMLMGLIRPSAGTATVLGHDVVRERHLVHRLVGYLPGDFRGYRQLSAGQYLEFVSNLRGGVDPRVVDTLVQRFGLDLQRRIGTMSHGNQQKVGIVQACMHEPDLLILDEPTQGLDPLMQREFLDLLREFRDAGRTVFLSSHVLSEVEAVADEVGIIRHGRLVMTSGVAELKRRARRRVALTFVEGVDVPVAALTAAAGVVELVAVDGGAELVVEGSMEELLRVAAPLGVERVISNDVDLEDLFMQYYEDKA
ncbi:MAG: ABC transporter ATP-binding protein [Actinobacteria bacterium]|nr:ABC transporter ATP-binding protein [Actinomycetota bacterium]